MKKLIGPWVIDSESQTMINARSSIDNEMVCYQLYGNPHRLGTVIIEAQGAADMSRAFDQDQIFFCKNRKWWVVEGARWMIKTPRLRRVDKHAISDIQFFIRELKKMMNHNRQLMETQKKGGEK